MSANEKTLDLEDLKRKASAATPGPWHWAGNTDTGEPYLATWISGAGRCQVLSIGSEDRNLNGRATQSIRDYAEECDADADEMLNGFLYDQFGERLRDPRLQFTTDLRCVNARDLAVYEVAPKATSREDPKVYRADVVGIRHPDAEFIAAANPQAVLALIARIEELEQMLTRPLPPDAHDVDWWRRSASFWAEQDERHEAERDHMEAAIREALDVVRSGSVPLGVSEARHWDRLLAESRRILSTAIEKGEAND